MEKIIIHVKADPEVRVQIPNPSDELKQYVVDRMFNISGDQMITAQGLEPFDVPYIGKQVWDKVQARDESAATSEPASEEELAALRKHFNDGDSEPKEKTEILMPVVKKESQEDPYWYKTGIKIDDDGSERFKTRYICPECGNKGNHYIYEDSQTVDCHECGEPMFVKESTPEDDGLTRDAYGNFYVAGNMIPLHERI
jgi:DNA-directed RNA polymerase subunit RPC12/RpoP